MQLVVTHAFGQHGPGDRITAVEEVAAVLESHPTSVVKVADAPPAPSADAPAADAEAAPRTAKRG